MPQVSDSVELMALAMEIKWEWLQGVEKAMDQSCVAGMVVVEESTRSTPQRELLIANSCITSR
jgi:hypothetical protein